MATIDRLLGRERSGEDIREAARERDPKLVDLAGEEAEEVMGALAADTAQDILAAVYEEPRTASELADAAETSLQNAIYHLEKLSDAGLIEVADTWYSEQGTEMKVYAPANGAVVLVAGDQEEGSAVRAALKRAVGGLGVVGLASLAIGRAIEWFRPEPEVDAEREVMMAAESTPAEGGAGGAEGTATEIATTATADGAGQPLDALGTLPPELLFFLGGALAVLLMTAVWYRDHR